MDTNIGEMEEERLEDSFEEEDVEHVQESSLPVGWMAVTDPESQEVYYANPSTGESSWDRPGGEEEISNDDTTMIDSSPPSSSSSSSLPPGWIQTIDPKSQQTYYSNPSTGESSWDPPVEGTNEKEQTKVAPDDVTSSTEKTTASFVSSNDSSPPLPSGWSAIKDPKTQRLYYANALTGETSWTSPLENDVDDTSEEDGFDINEKNDETSDQEKGDETVKASPFGSSPFPTTATSTASTTKAKTSMPSSSSTFSSFGSSVGIDSAASVGVASKNDVAKEEKEENKSSPFGTSSFSTSATTTTSTSPFGSSSLGKDRGPSSSVFGSSTKDSKDESDSSTTSSSFKSSPFGNLTPSMSTTKTKDAQDQSSFGPSPFGKDKSL